MFSNKDILLCRPEFFDVNYEINPWMHVSNRPEKSLAGLQWKNLVTALEQAGAKLRFIEPVNGWPDMVFTANGGFVIKNKVLLPRMKYPERAGEEDHFEKWFLAHNFETFKPSHFFEGEGDLFLIKGKLYCGYGFRSVAEAYPAISSFLGIKDLIYCELKDPSFYHLDTCFLPLNDNLVMIHEPALSRESVRQIRNNLNVISVPEIDARNFACNSVVIGNNIVMPAECPAAMELLAEKGFNIFPVSLSEFIKSGGAAKCLSLKLGQG